MRGKGVAAAVMAAALVFPCAASAQQVTGLTATQDVGFTTLKWNPVAGATDYQIERTTTNADGTTTQSGRRRLAAAAHGHAGQAGLRRVGLRARRALHVAGAGPPRHRQPAAVLGAADGDDAADPGRRPADRLGDAHHQRLHVRRRGGHLHGRARRLQRPHAGGRAGRDASRPADEPVDHRLSEAAGHRRGDLRQADLRDQLQRARQRGLGARVVLHDGPPAGVDPGPRAAGRS